MPTIKELLSISDWNGSQHVDDAFYLDSSVFDFDYPEIDDTDLTGTHSNQMMGQTWSSTSRIDSENLPGDVKFFFNFLDAHIKSNSATNPDAELFYRCVRGDELANDFTDNGDDTVTDEATGLMWQQANGSEGSDLQFSWRDALGYCEDLSLAGHDDWRLPDVKELQSIVEYAPSDWSTRPHGARLDLHLRPSRRHQPHHPAQHIPAGWRLGGALLLDEHEPRRLDRVRLLRLLRSLLGSGGSGVQQRRPRSWGPTLRSEGRSGRQLLLGQREHRRPDGRGADRQTSCAACGKFRRAIG